MPDFQFVAMATEPKVYGDVVTFSMVNTTTSLPVFQRSVAIPSGMSEADATALVQQQMAVFASKYDRDIPLVLGEEIAAA